MSNNPYEILGLSKKADDKEIKSAYRKLAKQCHPDLNPGNKEADNKFKLISVAYDLLLDKDKRSAYDRGEIDMEGNPQYQKQQYYKDFAEGPQGHRYYSTNTGDFSQEDIESIFGSFFDGGVGGRQAGFKKQANDAHYKIEIDFMEAAKGAKKRITMPNGKVLDISIPEGMQDGGKLRLKGQGSSGNISEHYGDAYVEVHIRPDPFYQRQGNDIYIDVPIGIHESILGAKIKVPTIHGSVEMQIPKGANTGQTLRLRGKGIKGGDQYIRLNISMPKEIDKDLEEAISQWAQNHQYDPRTKKEFA